MSSIAAAADGFADRRGSRADRIGDLVLRGLCTLAALLAIVAILAIAHQVISGASPAISKFGLGFIGHTTWNPVTGVFGAGVALYGTAVTSAMALLLATPLAISIGLYLALMAPGPVRAVVGPLVEMLAAIPSVIMGFWGIIVLAPWLQGVDPRLHQGLGFLPIFGTADRTGTGLFTAGIILTIMILPIIASISRALGEAIAVTEVLGAGNAIHGSLLQNGDTLASKIAEQFTADVTPLEVPAVFYLATILLVLAVVSNLSAHAIARRFDVATAVSR